MQYLKIATDFLEDTEDLTDSEFGRLIKSMLRYANDDTFEPNLKGNERFKWPTARKGIRRQWSEYREMCERNKGNRQKALTSRDESSQVVTTNDESSQYEYEYDYERKDISSPKVEDISKRKFSRPSVEEVSAYCRERGNGVDPAAFVDFYTANGWRVGRNPMKDWKAAVRNWEKKDRPKAGRMDFLMKSIEEDMKRERAGNEAVYLTDGNAVV
jgi:hypothetical protein